MRALAASFVVLGHVWGFQYSVVHGSLLRLGNCLAYSHLAVDVFIVISGYCLMLPIPRDASLPGGARAFYYRRARRILPPVYAALVFSALLAALVQSLGRHSETIITWRVVAANLLLQDALPHLNTLDGVLWSVALELKIYVVFPVLLWILRRSGWIYVFAASATASLVIAFSVRLVAPGFSFYHSCPWYLILFTIGAAAARIPRGGQKRHSLALGSVVMGSIAALAFMIWAHPIGASSDPFVDHLPAIDVTTGAATAALLALLSWPGGGGIIARLRTALEIKPIVRIGMASYSLYLIHLPCLYVARIIVNRLPFLAHNPAETLAATAIVGLPAVVSVTWLFYLTCERPYMSSSAKRNTAALAPRGIDQ